RLNHPLNCTASKSSDLGDMQLVRELRNERVSAKFRARTRIRASFLQENSKLNETRYFSGSFNLP
ncbi:hypothetical protein, partial [Treponema socranskii]